MASLLPKELFKKPARSLAGAPHCGACMLNVACKSPKIEIRGSGKRGILVIGSYPSKAEDDVGRAFTGVRGDAFCASLMEAGINPEDDCWFTYAAACSPRGQRFEEASIQHCRPLLFNRIEELQPKSIVLVGITAVRAVVGQLWKESVGAIDRWAGHKIPGNRWNAWLFPLWQASDFYITDIAKKTAEVRLTIQEAYLRQIAATGDRPWGSEGPPDAKKYVRLVYDEAEVIRCVERYIAIGGHAAFDYETTTLKPDGPYAQIVCCSICFRGRETISFPWTPGILPVMRRFFQSKSIAKIGANDKFEQRWTMAHTGVPVVNWAWDGMQSAHINRVTKQSAGVKFQSFIQLGVESYDDDVAPFLKGRKRQGVQGGNVPNRIKEAPLHKVLLYCGLDSYYEYLIADRQIRPLGHTFLYDD